MRWIGAVCGAVLLAALAGCSSAPVAVDEQAAAQRAATFVVEYTVLASARLAVAPEIQPDRRAVVLDRARQNLASASALLERPLPALDDADLAAAQQALADMAARVDRLRTCDLATASPPAAEGAPAGACSTPEALADDTRASRDTGAAVAKLIPASTLAPEDVTRLAALAQEAARAEGAPDASVNADETLEAFRRGALAQSP